MLISVEWVNYPRLNLITKHYKLSYLRQHNVTYYNGMITYPLNYERFALDLRTDEDQHNINNTINTDQSLNQVLYQSILWQRKEKTPILR